MSYILVYIVILVNRLNKLEVFYHERSVGTMALYQNRLAAFASELTVLMEQ